MSWPFTTVPEELLEVAEAAADHFDAHTYKVAVEPSAMGYPNAPTMLVKRGQTTMVVEVVREPDEQALEAWMKFARSTPSDFRVAIVVPTATNLAKDGIHALRGDGLGVYVCDDDGNIAEQSPPRDLNMTLDLPGLDTLSPWLRKRLALAYEQFGRSEWQECFESASLALETECRRYLWRGVRLGRIQQILDANGGVWPLTTKAAIDKLTLGDLAKAFRGIHPSTKQDTDLAAVLAKINKDRIGVVHHKAKAAVQKRLRKNVGPHMWDILGALRTLEP